MRGPIRESELVEAPPHRAEFLFSVVPCRPLPASGAREAAQRGEGNCTAVPRRPYIPLNLLAFPRPPAAPPGEEILTIVA
jgi:hypothetical protein